MGERKALSFFTEEDLGRRIVGKAVVVLPVVIVVIVWIGKWILSNFVRSFSMLITLLLLPCLTASLFYLSNSNVPSPHIIHT